MESWLVSIGLGAHAAAFRARDIERDRVAELSDAELADLGLDADAVRQLRRAAPEETHARGAWQGADRRPLTMVFVDLVGSSRLAEELPPEDLMELLRRYEQFCAGPIARFGGRIVRMVGDGLLAYFCHPVANENDPERAVRAALAITRSIGRVPVPGGEPLVVRIGIATGPVVVGDLVTENRVWRDTVVGAAPNLAARLQSLARPGGIVVSEETYQHVRERFEFASLGNRDLHGMKHARAAWEVVSEADLSKREVRVRASALFGRARELATLEELWAGARSGAGAAAVISGEPGIGKSRLVEALVERAAGDGARVIRLEGAEFDMDSPLRPVATWLQRTAALAGDEGTPSERLAGRLRGWTGLRSALAYLLEAASSGPAPGATPEQLRAATLDSLVDLVLAETGHPVAVVVEDLHWCDPTTVEWIERLAGTVAARPLFLVVTIRQPETLPPLLRPGGRGCTRHLPLEPLGDEDVAGLARSMLLDARISPAVLRVIQRKAGGRPLFVEEVVRTLVARDELGLEAIDEADQIIPVSVHEALTGRLDRLGEDKRVAQVAAVIGPDIRHDVLERVCAAELGVDSGRVTRAIANLRQVGIFAEGAMAAPSSTFAHGLIRDVAYEGLLRDRRQHVHLAVARVLRETAPEVVAAQPEAVARHYEEGDDAAASLPYWLAAARLSLARSALLEGSRLLRRGLAAVERLPGSASLQEIRLEMMALLGPALLSLHGPGSDGTLALYRDAYVLATQSSNSRSMFPLYWGWWRVSSDCFEFVARSRDVLERARALGDPELVMQAHHCRWASDFHHGKFCSCSEHVAAGLDIYDQLDLRHHAQMYGNHDAKVCALGELAMLEWMQGRPVSAASHDRAAAEWAARLGHLGSHGHMLEIRLDLAAFSRDPRHVRRAADLMGALATEHDLEDAGCKSRIFSGWARAVAEDPVGGLALLEAGLERHKEIGSKEDLPLYYSLHADALIRARQPERALALLQQAEPEFVRLGLCFWHPEVRRLQGDALIGIAPANARLRDDACQCYRSAIDIAEEQGAIMLAMRAAVALAKCEPGHAARALVRGYLAHVEDDSGYDVTAARAVVGAAHDWRDSAPAA